MIPRKGAQAQGFLQWDSIESSSFAGENSWGGRPSQELADDTEVAPNIPSMPFPLIGDGPKIVLFVFCLLRA